MNHKLSALIKKVETISIPIDSELFGGAGLIVSDDPNRTAYEKDVLVLSVHATTLSWFVFELKYTYSEKIDSINRYPFYGNIGTLLNQAIEQKLDVREQMQYVLHHFEKLESVL